VTRAESEEADQCIAIVYGARPTWGTSELLFAVGSLPTELLAVTFPFALQLGH
jgi:hypothetical protein